MSLRVARPGQMTWYVRPLPLLIAPAVLVAIVPLATPTNAGSPPKLTITASVKRSDPKSCAYEWSATVRNEGPALVVEGTGQLISAEWPPLKQLTSGALPRLGPGDAATFAGSWSRSPGTTQLVLSAAVDDPSFGHASATKTEALPAEGTPSFAIESVKATDASYSFTVRNQIAEGMSAVYVRVSSAKGWHRSIRGTCSHADRLHRRELDRVLHREQAQRSSVREGPGHPRSRGSGGNRVRADPGQGAHQGAADQEARALARRMAAGHPNGFTRSSRGT